MGSLSATTESLHFGKYRLVARLATGGMAEIFLARLQGAAGFEKLVCIKRILPHLARDKQFVAMFLDEARIAARISHPNVCQVFELGELEGSYYIAMEYLEGVPLACFRGRDYVHDMPDPRLVAGIAIQACEALHHAHQLKNIDGSVMEVVHRDVSPQNLFVTVDGIVKVLDFGIAKIQDATVKTGTGAIKGTYAYMAPEQLRGERVDRRTDVFALGIVMWEILIGRYLFRRDTDFLTFQAITGEPIDDVAALRPDVPAALSDVIRTALSRDRNARFPTARMLGEAIAAAIQPFTGSAISEDIARAFPRELHDQAALIRVAREGGTLDLDVERGPAVRSGTEMLTTPTSQRFAIAEISVAERSAAQVYQPPPVAPLVDPLDHPRPHGGLRWRPLVIAAIALGVGGAGAYFYARVSRDPVSQTPVAAPAAGSAVVAATLPSDAALPPPVPAPAVDAMPLSPPLDAAPSPAPSPAGTAGEPHKTPRSDAPRPRQESRPSGPPGFITIDSTPVYATVSIDGKSYGETPLVNVALAPGRHRVHAVAPSGAARDIVVTIEAGKTAPVSRIEW